jgi:hypothetical protein
VELSQTAPIPAMLIWRRIPVVAIVALGVNLLLLVIAQALGAEIRLPTEAGAPDAASLSGEQLWLPVTIVTLAAVVAAGLLFSVLLRFGPPGVMWFNVSITVLMLLSLVAPLTLPIGWAARLVLALMHVVVWAGLFFGLGRAVLR